MYTPACPAKTLYDFFIALCVFTSLVLFFLYPPYSLHISSFSFLSLVIFLS